MAQPTTVEEARRTDGEQVVSEGDYSEATPAATKNPTVKAITGILDAKEGLAEVNLASPEREVSLAITKIEEAQMWFERSQAYTNEFSDLGEHSLGS